MTGSLFASHAPRLIALFITAALTACGAGDGSGLDSNGRPINEGGGTPPAGQSDFQQIQNTIFTPICTACHIGAGAPQGLRLDAANSFALLVSTPSSESPGTLRVKPGDPGNSYLVQKIEGRAGARMPLGGAPLPQESIDLVRRWIAAGAPAPTASAVTGGSLQVLSTIPESGEQAVQQVNEVLVILSREVDPSVVSVATVMLIASGGDAGFDDGNERVVPLQSVRVPARNLSTIVVTPATPLPNDTYELVLKGTGATAVAGMSTGVLDGNFDGRPGGDFTTTFEIGAGEAR
ncbi:MAG: Ig-like domain-containing protein [Gammaproteobacteria bacterium]